MAVKKRLGRGLGALIPEISNEEKSRSDRLRDVSISDVKPNPFQPRESFDPITLNELKQSIAENGVIQPITVRISGNGYELIAGERRLRAVQELGLETIPAFVIEVNSDQEMIEMSLIENIQRENLNPIDEANGYRTLMTECNLTQDVVAKRVGKDRSTITNFLRLLKLPKVVQESVAAGEISQGHARALLGVSEESQLIDLWKKTVKRQLSVRQVEKLAKDNRSPEKQPQKMTVVKKDPFVQEIEDKLRTLLGTQVRIVENNKGQSGKIEVEYYSSDDMDRLLELFEKLG